MVRKLLFARRHPEAQTMPAVCARLRDVRTTTLIFIVTSPND